MRNVISMPRADADLIREARAGSSDAFEQLYTCHRRHALNEARRHTKFDPDDVVSEAFASVFRAISAGGGPDTEFRAYLRTAVRNAAVQMSRRPAAREVPTDLDADGGVTPTFTSTFDDDEMYLASVVDDSLSLLPDRWMQVLWATEVEGRKPREIGRDMHMSANSVAALTKRARQGFRAEFAKQLDDRSEELHRLAALHRDAYDAGTLSPMTAALLNAHIDSCSACSEQPVAVSRVVAWPVALWLGATSSTTVAALIGGGGAATVVAGTATKGGKASRSASASSVATVAAAVAAVAVGVAAVAGNSGPSADTVLAIPPATSLADQGEAAVTVAPPTTAVFATTSAPQTTVAPTTTSPAPTATTSAATVPPAPPAPPIEVAQPAATTPRRPTTTVAGSQPTVPVTVETTVVTTLPETTTLPSTTVAETLPGTIPETTTSTSTTTTTVLPTTVPETTTTTTTPAAPANERFEGSVLSSGDGTVVVQIRLLTDAVGAQPVSIRLTSPGHAIVCNENCSTDGAAVIASAVNWHQAQPLISVITIEAEVGETAQVNAVATVNGEQVASRTFTLSWN